MKPLLFAWLLLVSGLTFAQTSRTDVLYKTDRTAINVKIDELTDTDVVYFEPTAPKTKKTLARSQVWKVVFSDGSTEVITAIPSDAAGTDQITLIDRTTVPGTVVRRDDRKLYYTKPGDPANTQYELPLSRLDRIHYADGREENFRKAVGGSRTAEAPTTHAEAASNPPESARMAPERAREVNYAATNRSVSYTDPKAFSRLNVTVGPEISLFSQSGTARWSNQFSGLGMNQSIGGSVRLDYRLIRPVAISFTGGYAQWKLIRNYLLNGTERYDETIQLTRIPIQAGIKLYAFRGLYLLPEAGVNLMTARTKTSGTHPKPTDQQSSSTPITYGASLGYEFRLGGLLLDLSGRYQILDVKSLSFGTIAPALTEKVQFGSLRLGIGFNAFHK